MAWQVGSGSASPRRLHFSVSLGFSHLKAFLGLEEQLPRCPSLMIGKLVLAAGGSPQFPSLWALPQGCLNILTTWQLASPRTSDPGEVEGETAVSSTA